jgi:hypothetical protein
VRPSASRYNEVRIVGGCEEADAVSQTPIRFDHALAQHRSEIARLDSGWARISASHESLDSLLRLRDLTSMIRFASEGTFLMAGIPWFATLFGRDNILTALFALPFNPALAVGTLKPWPLCKARKSIRGARSNPERSCMKFVPANWRLLARCRSAFTTAVLIPPTVSLAPWPLCRNDRRSAVS